MENSKNEKEMAVYRKILAIGVTFLLFALVFPSQVLANSVETYPAGVFSLGLGFGYTFSSRRFTNEFSAKTESIVDDYNVTIKGEDLSDAFKGETIGKLDVDLNSYGMEFDINFGLGITDKLSMLFMLPVKHGYNSVDVRLYDSTMVLIRDSKGKPSLLMPKNVRPDLEPLNADDFKDVLTCTPDPQHPICAFNYDPLKDFDYWGLGDMILGMRYKIGDLGWLRHGLTLFAKFPTGYTETADDLFDSDLGKGHFDIGFWYGLDIYPTESLFFNVTAGYTAKLPYQRTRRVSTLITDPETGRAVGKIPIAMYWQKMKMNIDPGDNWDVYFGFNWQITDWLIFNNEQYFYWEYKDDYWAAEKIPQDPYANPADPNYTPYYIDWYAQEYQTDFSAIQTMNSITFSTLKWVEKGKFPIPFTFGVFYSYLIAGKNVEQENIVGCSFTMFASFQALGVPWPFDSNTKEESPTTMDENITIPAKPFGAAETKGTQPQPEGTQQSKPTNEPETLPTAPAPQTEPKMEHPQTPPNPNETGFAPEPGPDTKVPNNQPQPPATQTQNEQKQEQPNNAAATPEQNDKKKEPKAVPNADEQKQDSSQNQIQPADGNVVK